MASSNISYPGAAPGRIPTADGAVRGTKYMRTGLADSLLNYYEVLRVEPEASREEITKAFWRRAEEWHPKHTETQGARERFVTIYQAFQILGNPARRYAYDRLKAIDKDFLRAREPAWPRYTRWVENARIEGESFAEDDFEKLRDKILISNTFLFLRIIALGEELPDARRWMMIGLKISALAVIFFFVSHITELSPALANYIPWELRDLGKTEAARQLIGVGLSAVIFLSFFAMLIIMGIRSSASDSILGRGANRILKLIFYSEDEAFPLIPVVLVFGAVYALLVGILALAT